MNIGFKMSKAFKKHLKKRVQQLSKWEDEIKNSPLDLDPFGDRQVHLIKDMLAEEDMPLKYDTITVEVNQATAGGVWATFSLGFKGTRIMSSEPVRMGFGQEFTLEGGIYGLTIMRFPTD